MESNFRRVQRTGTSLSTPSSPSSSRVPQIETPFSTLDSYYCELDEALTNLVGLLIEVDHDMAIFEFALVSSISRKLRTEAEAESLQVGGLF